MDIGFSLIIAFAFGLVVGLGFRRPRNPKEFKLNIMIQLDATQPIKITAVGKDAEGNNVDLNDADLRIEAVATEGNFGSVNDEMDTFNPGDAGATGTLRGSVTIDDVEYVAEVEVELVPGALSAIALEFAPVE